MAIQLPNGRNYFATSTGAPGVGYRLYTYIPGTSTPKDTYTSASGAVANTNPVIADARGEMSIYWIGSYDVVLKDASDNTIWGPERLEETGSANDLEERLADTSSASNGPGLVGSPNMALNYAVGTLGWTLKNTGAMTAKRLGLDSTGATDVTTAVNNALALYDTLYFEDGIYRVDGTITILSHKTIFASGNAQFRRRAANTANTNAMCHVRGIRARLIGGRWDTNNNSPNGVIVGGHLDHTTSNYLSEWAEIRDITIYCKDYGGAAASPRPGFRDGVGVYIPSSQPNLGSSAPNYFGYCDNIMVHNATTAYLLTDTVNGWVLNDCGYEYFYSYGFMLTGAYGNTIRPKFGNGSYFSSNAACIYLTTNSYPAAPWASSIQASRNTIEGWAVETYTSCAGLIIDTGCQNNDITFRFNAIGTAITYNPADNNTINLDNYSVVPAVHVKTITGQGSGNQVVRMGPVSAASVTRGLDFNGNGNITPITDNDTVLGTSTLRLAGVTSRYLTLIDGGVPTPSTIAGHAIMYIDNGDGDLKIRFGDGTIKTIVTDT